MRVLAKLTINWYIFKKIAGEQEESPDGQTSKRKKELSNDEREHNFAKKKF